MTDDFTREIQNTLDECAATLAEQNQTWSQVRAAFAELDVGTLVCADPGLLDDLEAACLPRHSASNPQPLGAIRA